MAGRLVKLTKYLVGNLRLLTGLLTQNSMVIVYFKKFCATNGLGIQYMIATKCCNQHLDRSRHSNAMPQTSIFIAREGRSVVLLISKKARDWDAQTLKRTRCSSVKSFHPSGSMDILQTFQFDILCQGDYKQGEQPEIRNFEVATLSRFWYFAVSWLRVQASTLSRLTVIVFTISEPQPTLQCDTHKFEQDRDGISGLATWDTLFIRSFCSAVHPPTTDTQLHPPLTFQCTTLV